MDVTAIRRGHVEAFIEDLLGRYKPATAHNRYRGLQSFFKWLEDEGEIRDTPVARALGGLAVGPLPVVS